MSHVAPIPVLFGTYTPASGESRGIYRARFDPATRTWSQPSVAAAAPNPTFLAWHPKGPILYALSESGEVDGKPGGALAAYRLDRSRGRLDLLNVEPTGGGSLAHVAVAPDGAVAAVASYHRGEIALFPLLPDGRLAKCRALVRTSGTLGPNARRQEKAHPHSITFSAAHRSFYVCDLGFDEILQYRIGAPENGVELVGRSAAAPGAGPRHSRFSPDHRFLYVINELDSTVTSYRVEPGTGALSAQRSHSTLPGGFTGENICAEIRISADGRFVYGSNRGHDSLAVFARDASSGELRLVEVVACGGRHPRNFDLSPDGNWLICANRDTNDAVAFQIDRATGRLALVAGTLAVPQAVCVAFVPE